MSMVSQRTARMKLPKRMRPGIKRRCEASTSKVMRKSSVRAVVVTAKENSLRSESVN